MTYRSRILLKIKEIQLEQKRKTKEKEKRKEKKKEFEKKKKKKKKKKEEKKNNKKEGKKKVKAKKQDSDRRGKINRAKTFILGLLTNDSTGIFLPCRLYLP